MLWKGHTSDYDVADIKWERSTSDYAFSEIRREMSFFSFGFARVSEVRHIRCTEILEKILETSGNFVSLVKWEPCPEKASWAAPALDGVNMKRV